MTEMGWHGLWQGGFDPPPIQLLSNFISGTGVPGLFFCLHILGYCG